MNKRLAIFLVIIFIGLNCLFAKTINFPGDYATIQDAIDRAYYGDTVLVAPGTYYENLIWPNGNGIRLVSSGDYTNTILDGSKSGTVISMNFTFDMIDTATVIDGFTIQNGETNIGGGFYLNYASPTLKNLHIKDHHTIGISYQSGDGAAIYMKNHSSPHILDCEIYDNYAQWGSGAGIYAMDSCFGIYKNLNIYDNISKYGGGAVDLENYSSPNIINVVIDGNTSYEDGGGLYCKNHSSPLIYETVISNNFCELTGGGISCHDFSSPQLENVTIEGNSSGYAGGGIFCKDSSNITINSTQIKGNRSVYSDGGGVALLKTVNTINNSSIASNMSGDDGAGVYISDSKVTIMNSTIHRNHASFDGGGIYVTKSDDISFFNLKIIENKANDTGGGMMLKSSTPEMNTIIFAHNFASNNGGGLALSTSSPVINGFSFITNKCNRKGDGIYTADNSEPHILNCNFMEHYYAIYNDDSGNIFKVDTSYFGNPSGPLHNNDNPTGRGDRVNDNVRVSSWSSEPEMAAPPIPMIDFRITNRSEGEVTLSWEHTQLADIQKYVIHYDDYMPEDFNFEYSMDVDKNSTSVTITGLTPGVNYHFAGTVVDREFYESWYTTVVTIDGTVGVEEEQIVKNFELQQNYPNPFNPTTNIKYSIPTNSLVRINLFDILGNHVKTLVNENKSAGNYLVLLDGSDIASGVYFYKISTNNFTAMKKCILIK